jgi:uncharacterized protein (DUF697 family)
MDLNIESIKAKFNELYNSVEQKVRDEIDDERNPQAAVRRVILAYSGAAAAVNLSPIPFTEVTLLTPLHAAMVLHIGKRLGQAVSLENAGQVFKEIIGAVGLSVAARLTTTVLLKVGLPVVGGYLRAPAIFAMTYGIGRVAEDYYLRRGQGLDFDAKAARELFKKAVKEGRVEGAYARAQAKKEEVAAKKPRAKKPAAKKRAKK